MSYNETTSQQRSSRRALRQRRRDERGHRRRKIQALATGGLVLGFGATATLAAWSDQKTATAQFSSGEFAIESRTGGNDWNSTDEMQFESAAMYPGQSVYSDVYVRSSPDTSVAGTVTVSGAGTQNRLAQHLRFRAITVEPAGIHGDANCSSAAFESASSKDYLFGTGTDYIRMRDETTTQSTQRLEAQQAETIAYCFEVQLAPDAPNETQNLSADYSWKFYAQSITE